MKNGFKYLALFVTLVMALGLVACGDDDLGDGNGASSAISNGGGSGTSSTTSTGGGGVPTVFEEDTSLPTAVRNYYSAAYGKSGTELWNALKTIVTTGHANKGYAALWNLYKTADKAPNGKVWDMYSSTKEDGTEAKYWFTFGTDQDSGSGGTTEGEYYNREHTWPQSAFGSWSTAQADAHHITPVDKLVNNKHSNFAYGEVTSPTWTSLNGSKLGPGRPGLGFSGTVFEIIEIYKGDHARMHFYMALRYDGNSNFLDCSWASPGAKLKPWYKTMLLDWHRRDPLHQKEIDRNQAVFNHQGNRNPFIDYPILVEILFGDGTGGTGGTSSSAGGSTSSAGGTTSSSSSSSAPSGPPANPGDTVAENTDFEANFAFGSKSFFSSDDFSVNYSTEDAKDGNRSVKFDGTPAKNGYSFSIGDVRPRGTNTKITFWLKGTANGRSLSVNMNGTSGPFYNLKDVSGNTTVNPNQPNAQNDYMGSITATDWVKITLAGLTDDPTDIAFKHGPGTYNLYLDEVRYEE